MTTKKKRRIRSSADEKSEAIFQGALAVIAKHKALAEAETNQPRTRRASSGSKVPAQQVPRVEFTLKPRVKKPVEDYRLVGCGCCTGGGPKDVHGLCADRCTCFMHQDMRIGIRPKKCSKHKKESSK